MNALINGLTSFTPNRRGFVQKLGIAGALLGATGVAKIEAQSMLQDSDILNFALNLEYLEAEFYTMATTGKTLAQTTGFTLTGTGNQGQVTGGSQVTFTDPQVQAIALELAQNEQTHVKLLQSALGGSAVAEPAINLAALGIGFANQSDFLTVARAFEDLGVSAYGGAAPLIQNKTTLGIAARILAVEAEHAGAIRAAIARLGVTTTALDGADHLPPPAGATYFSTDSSGLTETRTPQQVLGVAYATSNAAAGGFFPNGVNGIVNTSGTASASSDGATLTASPNPVVVQTGSTTGQTTISWNAPQAKVIQIRVGSPNGALFTNNLNTGSMMTGLWVREGTTLYLQDVSLGQANTSANTIATLVLHTTKSS